MILETQKWKQAFEAKKADRSLRSHLWLVVCQTPHLRVQQIAQADPKGELIQLESQAPPSGPSLACTAKGPPEKGVHGFGDSTIDLLES